MEILNIGPLELIIFLIIAFILLGPKGMIMTAYNIGKWIRGAIRSPMWREILRYSQEIRELPKKIMDETGLEAELKAVRESTDEAFKEVDKSIKEVTEAARVPEAEHLRLQTHTPVEPNAQGKKTFIPPDPIPTLASLEAAKQNTDTEGMPLPADSIVPAAGASDTATGAEPVIDPRRAVREQAIRNRTEILEISEEPVDEIDAPAAAFNDDAASGEEPAVLQESVESDSAQTESLIAASSSPEQPTAETTVVTMPPGAVEAPVEEKPAPRRRSKKTAAVVETGGSNGAHETTGNLPAEEEAPVEEKPAPRRRSKKTAVAVETDGSNGADEMPSDLPVEEKPAPVRRKRAVSKPKAENANGGSPAAVDHTEVEAPAESPAVSAENPVETSPAETPAPRKRSARARKTAEDISPVLAEQPAGNNVASEEPSGETPQPKPARRARKPRQTEE